jgi:hypothetical protein
VKIVKNTNTSMMLKKLRIALGIIISSASIFAPTAIVLAETFSIDGIALNTNDKDWPRKHGQPLMYTWELNPNDLDQQFDRQGDQLRHRSTGKCLNAYQPAQGSTMNVWPCIANDPDQKFVVINVRDKVMIQRKGTNFCLDMPRRSRNTLMTLINCDSNNGNQLFVNAGTPPPPPPPPITSTGKMQEFFNRFNGARAITRYDLQGSSYDGQCVTLIARWLQDYHGASKTSLAIGHGRDTARVVASKFSGSYLPVSDPRDPIPGTIMSFPNSPGSGNCEGRLCGHVALVLSSSRSGSTLTVRIVESNANAAAPNTTVTSQTITVNTSNPSNFTSSRYGGGVYWINPRNP